MVVPSANTEEEDVSAMPPQVPEGWELHRIPSKPDDRYAESEWFDLPLSSVQQKNWQSLRYEWEAASGVPPVQGNCGVAATFSASFYLEDSSTHSFSIGFNANARKEVLEITGAYTYTFGTTVGTGVSVQETYGGNDAFEYMMVPIVLAARYGRGYVRDGYPWHLTLAAYATQPATTAGVFALAASTWDDPIYMRAGLMVVRRRCRD